jgi:hypothetical protein
MTDAEWNAEYAAFIKRLAEHQGRALAGDVKARQTVNEYSLCRWAGYHPIAALAVAESFIR